MSLINLITVCSVSSSVEWNETVNGSGRRACFFINRFKPTANHSLVTSEVSGVVGWEREEEEDEEEEEVVGRREEDRDPKVAAEVDVVCVCSETERGDGV